MGKGQGVLIAYGIRNCSRDLWDQVVAGLGHCSKGPNWEGNALDRCMRRTAGG